MHFANPWLFIVLLAQGCVLTMMTLRRLEHSRSRSVSRRALLRQQRLHCLALALCAAMLLLLPLVDTPHPPLQAIVSGGR